MGTGGRVVVASVVFPPSPERGDAGVGLFRGWANKMTNLKRMSLLYFIFLNGIHMTIICSNNIKQPVHGIQLYILFYRLPAGDE